MFVVLIRVIYTEEMEDIAPWQMTGIARNNYIGADMHHEPMNLIPSFKSV